MSLGRMEQREQPWILPAVLVACFGIASAVTLHWPPWGDEFHHLYTVRAFGQQGVSMNLLRTYAEMAGPLAFVMYGFWGRLVGFETSHLRLLSPLVALATCLLLAHLLRKQNKEPLVVLAGTLSIGTTPYVLGLSAFVFTDMLALFFMLVTLTGVNGNRPWITGVGVAGAVVTRQYLAFLVPAVAIALLMSDDGRRPWRNQHMAFAVLGLLPLAGLLWLWDGGLSPINEATRNYVAGREIRFNPHALALYVAVPGLYLAPLLVWRARAGIHRGSLTVGLALAFVTLVFPIQPSEVQINEGSLTVGFAHRALIYLLPPVAVNLAWFLAAAAWLTVAAEHVVAVWPQWRQREVSPAEVPAVEWHCQLPGRHALQLPAVGEVCCSALGPRGDRVVHDASSVQARSGRTPANDVTAGPSNCSKVHASTALLVANRSGVVIGMPFVMALPCSRASDGDACDETSAQRYRASIFPFDD